MINKYIDAEKLKYEIERLKGQLIRGACAAQIEMETNCKDEAYNEILALIDSLQQEQPKKYIELNGIKYREVPAKTNDKICKDCDYFLDNGTCELVDCPCIDDNTILERLNEQLEMDVEKEIEDYAYSLPHSTTGSSAYVSDKRLPIARQFGIKHAWSFEYVMEIAMHSYELGFNARKEE